MNLERLGILVTILSALCAALYFLIKEFKKSRLKYRHKLETKWTNEGDIILSNNGFHFINLELTVDKDDGEVTGTLKCKDFNNDIDIICSVDGMLYYKSCKLNLYHIRQGEFIVFGKAKLTLLKAKLLQWELLEGEKDFFPLSTILWRN